MHALRHSLNLECKHIIYICSFYNGEYKLDNRRLINHLQTAVAVIDKNMIIVDANEAYAKRNQQNLNNLLGLKCFEAAYNFETPCSTKSKGACPLTETFENQQSHSKINHFWIEDHAVVEEITTTPVMDKDGDIEYVIEEFRDITKLLGLKKGIISTCSYCKKIRDEDGQWVNFDTYLNKHTGADFSHGICGDCETSLLHKLKEKKLYSY